MQLRVRRGPLDTWRKKQRGELINRYVEHCADALLDVLEARGLIRQLVERYRTRERCIRPQGGGYPWLKARRAMVADSARAPR